MPPIFICWIRSFWLGILPALLIALDVTLRQVTGMAADAALAPPVAYALGWMLGVDPMVIEGWMLRLAPVPTLVVAQQRAGRARPYTLDRRARQ